MTTRAMSTARPATPAYAGVVAGVVLAGSVLLPWYVLNIAPPLSASSVSGWDATGFAQAAMVLGLLIAVASAALVLDGRRVLHLARGQRMALAWTVVIASVVAGALVLFRLVVMPYPADLLSRQIGIYVAAAAAVGAVLAALGQLATQD